MKYDLILQLSRALPGGIYWMSLVSFGGPSSAPQSHTLQVKDQFGNLDDHTGGYRLCFQI